MRTSPVAIFQFTNLSLRKQPSMFFFTLTPSSVSRSGSEVRRQFLQDRTSDFFRKRRRGGEKIKKSLSPLIILNITYSSFIQLILLKHLRTNVLFPGTRGEPADKQIPLTEPCAEFPRSTAMDITGTIFHPYFHIFFRLIKPVCYA